MGPGERFRRTVEASDRNLGLPDNAAGAAGADNDGMKTRSIPRRWQLAAGPQARPVPGAVAIRRYRLVPLAKAGKQPPKAVTA
jgi:hypothetical protein